MERVVARSGVRIGLVGEDQVRPYRPIREREAVGANLVFARPGRIPR